MPTFNQQKNLEHIKLNHAKELIQAQSMHELALERERQQFKSKEIAYTEAGQHLRSLNQFMWQVPGITIAVTGGLWYGVSLWENNETKSMALLFLAIFDFSMIFVLLRMRSVLDKYINLQKNSDFEKPIGHITAVKGSKWSYLFKWTKWKYLVVVIWSLLLLLAGVLSMIGVFYPQRLTNVKAMNDSTSRLTVKLENQCSQAGTHSKSSHTILPIAKKKKPAHHKPNKPPERPCASGTVARKVDATTLRENAANAAQ